MHLGRFWWMGCSVCVGFRIALCVFSGNQPTVLPIKISSQVLLCLCYYTAPLHITNLHLNHICLYPIGLSKSHSQVQNQRMGEYTPFLVRWTLTHLVKSKGHNNNQIPFSIIQSPQTFLLVSLWLLVPSSTSLFGSCLLIVSSKTIVNYSKNLCPFFFLQYF